MNRKNGGPYHSMTLQERIAHFWSNVRKTRGCWIWTGFKNQRGYGHVAWGSSVVQKRTHRLAWELTHRPLRPGEHVLHHCDVPSCVNPDHLYVGTNADNMRDAAVRKRLRRKLTDAQVRKLRSVPRTAKYIRPLAEKYGIHPVHAYAVARGHRQLYI